MAKKIILTISLLICLANPSFAGELSMALAPEYYAQGLRYEKIGDFFEAKIFYQKAILLNPGIENKVAIIRKIYEIDKRLADGDSQEIEQPQQAEMPASHYTESTESRYAGDNMVGISASENTPPSTKPRQIETSYQPKPTTNDFVTYYTGKEPFLQNCTTPLCQKFIFNNFGISYGKERNFMRAEGMFKECLKIDSFFQPAQINMSIIKDLKAKQ